MVNRGQPIQDLQNIQEIIITAICLFLSHLPFSSRFSHLPSACSLPFSFYFKFAATYNSLDPAETILPQSIYANYQ